MTLVKYWAIPIMEHRPGEQPVHTKGSLSMILAADVEKVIVEKDAQWAKTNAEYERVSKALSKSQAELARVMAELEARKKLVVQSPQIDFMGSGQGKAGSGLSFNADDEERVPIDSDDMS